MTPTPEDEDRIFMAQALELARTAGAAGETPVGAVVTHNGIVVGAGHNRSIADHDPSAHAEMLALRAAGLRLGNYRLPGATLYATLEPCPMCVGALIHARVARVVFGAHDPKTGALGGALNLAAHESHNHRFEVLGGVLAEAAAELLRAFFRERRRNARPVGGARP